MSVLEHEENFLALHSLLHVCLHHIGDRGLIHTHGC